MKPVFAPTLVAETCNRLLLFLTSMNCRNCASILTGNYCSSCGQPTKIDRVNRHYIVHEIQHVLHFEKGITHTVKELLYKPGPSINNFIKVDRSRLVKPVLFLVLTSLIYSTIQHFFHIEEGYIVAHGDIQNSTAGIIFQWTQNHYGYANIIMGLFIAFWLKLFYKTYDYNFFELLIMLCFVMGMGMLIMSFFSIFTGVTGLQVMHIAGIIFLAYCSGAIGHFYNPKRVSSYLKALASYVLGVITFSIAVLLAGFLIDLVRF